MGVTTTPVTAQAQAVRFWPTLLTLIAICLIGLGKAAWYAWLPLAWSFCAVREGWREAKAGYPTVRSEGRRPSPDSGRIPVYTD